MADVDVKQIQSVSDRPITLWLNGKEMQLSKLRPADIASAADYVRTLRVKQYQASITAEPAMIGIYSDAIAKIQCQPVSLADVLDDWNGRVKLVQLALSRAGQRITEAQVAEQLEHARDDFWFILCELSGLRRKEEPAENPTGAAASK